MSGSLYDFEKHSSNRARFCLDSIFNPVCFGCLWKLSCVTTRSLGMNLETSVAALQAQNVQLMQENDQLTLRVSLVQENMDLKARLSHDDTLGDFTGIVCIHQ